MAEAPNDWTRWLGKRAENMRSIPSMFAEEKPPLLPLPVGPFRYYQYGERTVDLDGCVEVEAAYYSAPPGWIGRRMQVQWDARRVRLLDPRTGQRRSPTVPNPLARVGPRHWRSASRPRPGRNEFRWRRHLVPAAPSHGTPGNSYRAGRSQWKPRRLQPRSDLRQIIRAKAESVRVFVWREPVVVVGR
jgi:hypothetical protein